MMLGAGSEGAALKTTRTSTSMITSQSSGSPRAVSPRTGSEDNCRNYAVADWAPSWAQSMHEWSFARRPEDDDDDEEGNSGDHVVSSSMQFDGRKRPGRIHQRAVTIQRICRGFLARRHFRTLVMERGSVSNKAFEHALAQAMSQTKGCGALLWHAVFCLVVFTFVYTTGTQTNPPARSVEAVLGEAFSVDNEVDVTKAIDVYDYIRALVRKLHSPEQAVVDSISDACRASLETCRPLEDALDYDCVAISPDSGFLDYNNRILFGLFLQQSRYEVVPCNDDVFSLYAKDVRTQECFREFSGAQTYAIPDIFGADGQYSLNNSRVLEPAYDFFAQQSPPGFWTLLDVGVFNFLEEKTLCDVDELELAGWIDYLTASVCLILPMQNRNGRGVWATIKQCFEFDIGGRVTERRTVTSGTLLNAQGSGLQLFLLIVYLGMLLWEFIPAAWQLCALVVQKRSMRISKVLRVALYVAHLAGIGVFVAALVQSEALLRSGLEIKERQLENLPALWLTLNSFSSVLNLLSQYESLLALIMLVMTVQTIMLLDFHPQLGFISKTLLVAVQDLSLFVVIYALIVLLYGMIGSILLGNDADDFESLSVSMISLFFISLGQFDLVVGAVPSGSGSGLLLYWVFFLSYIAITSIIMLNLLLSLIIEAFLKIDEQTKQRHAIEFSILESTIIYVEWTRFDISNYYLPKASWRLHGPRPHKEAVLSAIVPRAVLTVPLRLQDFVRELVGRLPWEEHCFRLRYELSQVFSARIVDRLIANMQHYTQSTRRK